MRYVTNAQHSRHETVVEYGAREMMKHKGPAAAARSTIKRIGGSPNMFISSGGGPVEIDEQELTEALWDRLADFTIQAIPRLRAGKEDWALDGTIQHFGQKPSIRDELMRRVIVRMGRDPFVALVPNQTRLVPNRSRIPLDELERTHRHVHDARKIRENFRDEDAEYAEIVPWTWPTDMQEIGTCESVMYASDKWQKRRGDLIDYKHIAESSQRLYVCKGLLTDYEPPHEPMKLAGPVVHVDGPMPDSFAVLAEILAVQCRLYEKRGGRLVLPRGDNGLLQINLPKAMLGAAVHPGTKQVFLVVYSGEKVLCMINGDALNVEKDGIVG